MFKLRNLKLEKPLKNRGGFKSNGLSVTLIFSFLCLIMVCAVTIVSFSISNSSKVLKGRTKIFAQQMAVEKVNGMNATLSNIEGKLDIILSSAKEARNVDKWITLGTLKGVFESDSKSIIASRIARSDNVIMSYPTMSLSANLSGESWYRNAVDLKGQVYISEPKSDPSTKMTVMTVSKSSKDENGSDIVAAVDIDVVALFEEISKAKVGQFGYSIVATKEGLIIAHPSSSSILKDINTTYSWGKTLIKTKNGTIAYVSGGKDYIIGFAQSESTGLFVISIMSSDEYKSELNSAVVLFVAIALFVLFIGIIVSVLVTRSIVKPIKQLEGIMEEAEKGNLNVEVAVSRKDEIGNIQSIFARSLKLQRQIISDINKSSKELESIGKDIMSSSNENVKVSVSVEETMDNLSEVLRTNSSCIEQANTGVEEISTSAQSVAVATVNIQNKGEQTAFVVKQGQVQIEKVYSSIENIKKSADNVSDKVNDLSNFSKEINTIVNTITSISSQTNLLALNAAIEAARAGDSGRGFAVVADEVRKLAEESNTAAKNIEKLIKNIHSRISDTVEITKKEAEIVEAGARSVSETKAAFQGIMDIVKSLSDDIGNITSTAEEQSSSVEEVSLIINGVNEAAEKSVVDIKNVVEMIRGQADSIKNLEGYANILDKNVGNFKDYVKKFRI